MMTAGALAEYAAVNSPSTNVGSQVEILQPAWSDARRTLTTILQALDAWPIVDLHGRPAVGCTEVLKSGKKQPYKALTGCSQVATVEP